MVISTTYFDLKLDIPDYQDLVMKFFYNYVGCYGIILATNWFGFVYSKIIGKIWFHI